MHRTILSARSPRAPEPGPLGLVLVAFVGLAAGCVPEAPSPQERPGSDDFAVRAVLDVGLNPHQIVFTADGDVAFVAAAGSDRIVRVDAETLELETALDVPGTPLGMALLPGEDEVMVSRFGGSALARYDLRTGELVDTMTVGGGASLFVPLPGDRWLVSVEQEDEMLVVDGSFRAIARYAVGDRPFPPVATSDGRLAFAPGYDDGTVTVVDLWNDTVVASVDVGPNPSGGAVLPGDVDAAVVMRGADRLALVNTASFQVVDTIPAGAGDSPFSLVVTPNGRLGFINATAGHAVVVLDLDRRAEIARVPVREQPIVMAVHPSGSSLWVASEGEDGLTIIDIPPSWQEGRLEHEGLPVNPGQPGAEAWSDPTAAELAAIPPEPATEVAVMSMIHGGHRSSERWGLEEVKATARAFDPDVLCVELPPDRWERIAADLAERGVVEEPRARVFPEYTDGLLHLAGEEGWEVVPCAGWTAEMNRLRNRRMAAFDADPDLADVRRRYRAERQAARDAHAQAWRRGGFAGDDDPRYLHSDAYDEAARAQYTVYDRVQNDLLGPGGWTNINAAHWRLVERAVVRHRGQRILVTFGGGHRYWLLDRLRERPDVRVMELEPFLPDDGP